MGRNTGSTPYSGNFEVQNSAPLDARGLVDTYADLIDSGIWNALDGGLYSYPGMTVAVPNDPDDTKNGVYMLKALPTTDPKNWSKVGVTDITIVEIPDSGGQLKAVLRA